MPRNYYYYQGFGGDSEVAVTGKGAFYAQSNPIAAFIKALQKALGVAQTGEWDLATHNALWAWVVAHGSSLPSVLPWKPEVCTSDGFPPGRLGNQPSDCVATEALILESIDEFTEANPEFASMLGWASREEMEADQDWAAAKETFASGFKQYIRSKLMTQPSQPPILPPEPPKPPEPSTKPSKASIGLILGGLAVAGLLFWALSRKTPSAPGA